MDFIQQILVEMTSQDAASLRRPQDIIAFENYVNISRNHFNNQVIPDLGFTGL
jgi:hypothetical protein